MACLKSNTVVRSVYLDFHVNRTEDAALQGEASTHVPGRAVSLSFRSLYLQKLRRADVWFTARRFGSRRGQHARVRWALGPDRAQEGESALGRALGLPGPFASGCTNVICISSVLCFRSVQLSPRQGLAMPRPELVPRSEAARAARGRGRGCGLLTRLRCPGRAALGGSPRAGLGVRARSLPPRAQEKRPAPASALSCRISVAGSGGRGGA